MLSTDLLPPLDIVEVCFRQYCVHAEDRSIEHLTFSIRPPTARSAVGFGTSKTIDYELSQPSF